MTITTGTALILAFCAGFAYFSRRFLGELYLERPIILAPLAGLIMGDLQTGLIMGATLELVFMGIVEIGGGVQQNMPIGSILGTAFAISAGLSVEEALLIAVPASVVGSFFELLAKTMSTIFVSGAEKFADQHNTKGFSAMVHLGNLAHFLAVAIPTFLALSLGSEAVQTLSESIPPAFQNGIKVVGQVLPAFGFALLLNSIATTALMPFFFLGFILAAYLSMGVLGVALVGGLIAAILIFRQGGLNLLQNSSDTETQSLISKQDQRTIFWRSFAIQSAFSFDRMQAIGFTWGLLPFLKKVYGETAELGAALKRHLTFFNTHPWVAGPCYALCADMEARHAKDPDSVDVSSIQAIKGSLMGPLAGAGDPVFHGTLRPVIAGIAIGFANSGLWFAPVFFFLVMNITHVVVRYYTLDAGFKLGSTLFEKLDPDSLSRLLEAVSIAGLMAIGGLVGTWINITTPLAYASAEGASVAIQPMLDNIFPKLLTLIATLLLYRTARKGVTPNIIMIGTLIVGLVLGALGILG